MARLPWNSRDSGLPAAQKANSADKKGIGDNLGLFAFPAVEGGAGAGTDAIGGGNGFAIGKNASPEAIDFVKYLTSAENQTIIAANRRGIPVVKGGEAGLTDPQHDRGPEDLLQLRSTSSCTTISPCRRRWALSSTTACRVFRRHSTPEEVAQAIEDFCRSKN